MATEIVASNVIALPLRRDDQRAKRMEAVREHARHEGYGELPDALAAKLERHIAKQQAAMSADILQFRRRKPTGWDELIRICYEDARDASDKAKAVYAKAKASVSPQQPGESWHDYMRRVAHALRREG